MGKIYNNAITTTAGFNYEAAQPLDDRDVVALYSDLASLVDSGISYEGMEVYVTADKKSYRLIGSEWKATALEAAIPTKVSQLENDSNFITADEVPNPDLSEYVKKADAVGKKTTEGGEIFNSAETAAVDAHAEGTATGAYGMSSHAEGSNTSADGFASHAEGFDSVAENDYSHAEGLNTRATGEAAHAEGDGTIACGYSAHAEGYSSIAKGSYSHAEGDAMAAGAVSHAEGTNTIADGGVSHAEGHNTVAYGHGSHVEGYATAAVGDRSHAEGYSTNEDITISGEAKATDFIVDTTSDINLNLLVGAIIIYNPYGLGLSESIIRKIVSVNSDNRMITLDRSLSDDNIANKKVRILIHGARGDYSHAEGYNTVTEGTASHSEGSNTRAIGPNSHTEGHNTVTSGAASHAEGYSNTASGAYSHAEGANNSAYGRHSHVEGNDNTAEGESSHAEGVDTKALFRGTHTEGCGTVADSDFAHAEGELAYAEGVGSHAEGYYTYALGMYSHAEGYRIREDGANSTNYGAQGNYSHSEGYTTAAQDEAAHAEGYLTVASGKAAHSEGVDTYAEDYAAHAEGSNTLAFNTSSHAEGAGTIASGEASHAEGQGTVALGDYSHAEGGSDTDVITISGAAGSDTFTVDNIDRVNIGDIVSYKHSTYGTASTIIDIDKNTGTIQLAEALSSSVITDIQVIVYHYRAEGHYAHTEGYNTLARGTAAHTEGEGTLADADYAHAEGYSTLAKGAASHAEGYVDTNDETYSSYGAWGDYSHTEGYNTLAESQASHAEGWLTYAEGEYTHAEGYQTNAFGSQSHTEGYMTYAGGQSAHAEGDSTQADGEAAHAEGDSTIAYGACSHTEGYGTVAIADYTSARGYNSRVGIYGYKLLSVNSPDTGTDFDIVLEDGDMIESSRAKYNYRSDAEEGAESGDLICFDGSNRHYDKLRIISMSEDPDTHNTILHVTSDTGEVLTGVKPSTSTDDFENWIYVLNRPDCGEFAQISQTATANGYKAVAVGRASCASGRETLAFGSYGHAEGRQTKAGYSAHAEGQKTQALGQYSHSEGSETLAQADNSHAEGRATKAVAKNSHAEGRATTASGDAAHAEGYSTTASGQNSHVEGSHNTASGECAHSEGYSTDATGQFSHSECVDTLASGYGSHAEGSGTKAEGKAAHAEGTGSVASGESAHVEGYGSAASGNSAHAEGYGTNATAEGSHTEGKFTTASGKYSHAEGCNTIASAEAQHVMGKYNCEDSDQAVILGNGITIQVEGGTESPNIILNDNWTGITGNITRITDEIDCLKFNATGKSVYTTQTFTAKADTEYVLRLKYKHISGSQNGAYFGLWFFKDGTSNSNFIKAEVVQSKYLTLESGWNLVTVRSVVPDGANIVRVEIGNNSDVTAEYCVGEISLAEIRNVIYHEEFEPTSNFKTTWTASNNFSGTAVQSYNNYYNNTYSLFLQAKGAWAKTPVFDVTPLAQYTISFKTLRMAKDVPGQIKVHFITDSGTDVTSVGRNICNGPYYDSSNHQKNWYWESFKITASASAAKAYVEFTCENASYGIDNLVIHSSDKSFTYFERSNAHTIDWNGNAWFAGDIKVGPDNNAVALVKDIPTNFLTYDEQFLHPYQQEQVKANIGIIDPPEIHSYITTDGNTRLEIYSYGSDTPQTIDILNGKDGVTPVKGVDYFTEADKADLVAGIPGKKIEYGEIFNDYQNNVVEGRYSHAEGAYTQVLYDAEQVAAAQHETHGGHAEGHNTIAYSMAAHSEGVYTTAKGEGSHAEGYRSEANGPFSHGEGDKGIANAQGAHAEGYHTRAEGFASHAEGEGTIASGVGQHASGRYNIEDGSKLVIVGNGQHSSNRSNAYTLDENGNGWFAGDITLGAKNRPVRATFSGTDDPNTLDIGNDGDIYIRYTD